MPAITLKKKSGQAANPVQISSRETPGKLFLAVLVDENLSIALETLFTVHILRKKNRDFRCEVLTHKNAESFFISSALFDAVHVLQDDRTLKASLAKFKPAVLYIPDPNLKIKLASFFSSGKIRIGGRRHRLLSWLRNHFQTGEYEDLVKLKSKGVDLIPESQEICLNIENFESLNGRFGQIPQDYIWLSMFDSHDLTAAWPISHAARLVRMMEKAGWKTIIPVPAHADVKKILQLRETAAGAIFLDNPSLSERSRGMAGASLVVGPAGAETLLASFLGKKIIELHDMRSRRIISEDNFKKQDETAVIKTTSFYTRAASSLKRNIMPPMQNCNDDCKTCMYNSCMEFISPERVFEAARRALLPL